MILHVDMDAFYASVEQRDRPELVGLPVIVGGCPERRGVVAAASYEARRFGVHSAMSSARARRLCPQAVFVPSRLAHYAAISAQLRAVFDRYTPLVEPLSLDEAFLDVTASERLFGPAAVISARIRAEIATELGLTASVGVAVPKFIAKLASAADKPDGLTVVAPGQEQAFLDPLPVERMWGVGQVATARLAGLGVRRVEHLRRLPAETLVAALGAGGRRLHELAHGIDPRPVVSEHQARQLSHETTFAEDVSDPRRLRASLLSLTEGLAERLRRQRLLAGQVTLKLRFDDFRTVTRGARLNPASHGTAALWSVARRLLETRPDRATPLRLIGVAAAGLEDAESGQGDLFDGGAGVREPARASLDGVADAVRDRFGGQALRRARTLGEVS